MAKIYRCRHVKKTKEASYLGTSVLLSRWLPCPPERRTSESRGVKEFNRLGASADNIQRPLLVSLKEKGVIAMGRDLDHDIGHGSHSASLLPLLANIFAEPGQGVLT